MCSFLRWGQDTEVLFRRPSFLIAVIRALVLVRIPHSSKRAGKRASQRSGRQTLSRGWQYAGVKLAAGFLNHGLGSHVLFAACNSNEVAREANRHGAFTTTPLARLATVCTDKISYTDLLRQIDASPM